MKDEIIEKVKEEAHLGIAQIISKIFATILEPILHSIDIVKLRIGLLFEKRQMTKDMNFIVNVGLLRSFLERHHFDCVIHTSHNGNHSNTGLGYKYIKPIFVLVHSENELLKTWCKHSSPTYTYTELLYYCIQHRSYTISEFDERLTSYFADYYKKVFFRRHRSVYYCIMSKDEVLTNENEEYIESLIDNILDT